MAEILICVADRVNEAEAVKTNQLYQRGDVIVAVADGHPWSAIERTKPEWRILVIPGAAPEAFASLMAPELSEDGRPSRIDWQKRTVTLDLDNATWTQAERDDLDHTQARTRETMPVREQQIRAATVPRGRLPGGVIEID
jgi:hypothetical protein